MATWRLVKQLTCPQCGDVMARATHQRFPPSLRIESPDGTPVPPTSGSLLVRLTQRQLADAGDPAREQAQARMDFLRANIGEVLFDLRCHRGHLTLATMPGIIRAMRRTPGSWVAPR